MNYWYNLLVLFCMHVRRHLNLTWRGILYMGPKVPELLPDKQQYTCAMHATAQSLFSPTPFRLVQLLLHVHEHVLELICFLSRQVSRPQKAQPVLE